MSNKIELPKAYEPSQHEDDIALKERESGLYTPENLPGDRKEVFSMVLPPPNATGTLHMGHAAMLAIEDIMIRFQRMRGKKTLWVPGTDHAAIATQVKVERILQKEEGKTRHDLGRDEFLKRVDKFVEGSRATINHQVREMGSSIDWTREAFTLDAKRNFAVRTMFKKMYDDGLIYRGNRIVNWDPDLQSTVSDDEVDRRQENAPFYYMQYGPFVIGTSRPETKFGDKYVVMHPDDKRYAKYENGEKIDLEWIFGPITATIIKDDAVDMDFGTGVMTITPWHDATDFAIAERHGLDKEQVIDYDGKLMSIAGEFEGLTITEGREKIVERLTEKGLMVKVDEKYLHNLAVNSRGGAIVEPQIMRQWFIDVNKEFTFKQSSQNPINGLKDGQDVTLKKLMQHVVRKGEIKIIPENFEKVYYHWIDNLQDWNISRQLWYGHRIPAWYKGEEVYVGIDAPDGEGWKQDEDVLDTWFSSGLWTFSTLGWPNNESSDLDTFHSTTVLETGRDIIFFWVARMILMTTFALGEVPFKYVYLHGMVRDGEGRKMSKSLDNSIDPLEMKAKFGTDATRLSLVMGMTPGSDTNISEEKIAGFRNFTNKLWNIARFVLMSVDDAKLVSDQPEAKTEADAWILSKLNKTIASVSEKLDEPQFAISQAGEELREFTWGDFADWYVEVAKVQLEDEKLKESTEAILLYTLQAILKMWHPFMPFVTTKLWESFGSDKMLLIEDWPAEAMAKEGSGAFERAKDIVSAIRAARASHRIERHKKVNAVIVGDDLEPIVELKEMLHRLAGIENLTISGDAAKPDDSISAIAGGVTIYIPLAGLIDTEAEKVRLQKELDGVAVYVASVEKKLGNKGFTDNAPEAAIAKEQAKLDEASARKKAIEEQLGALK
jgi:valyl-tRNA synthetase